MKKMLCLLMCIFAASTTWAAVDLSTLMNKVTIQLQAEQWVTTKTVLLTVVANSTVTDQDIGQVQSGILEKLKRISDQGQWHVVSFNRQQDQSGLENIRILAQVRLPQTDLAGLRNKAKAMSKPGETFAIDNVQFVPSEDETREAMSALRTNLYLQAKTEIDNLNKLYPDQKYYLYNIDFSQGAVAPMAMAASTAYMEKSQVNRVAAAPIDVGNKVYLQANVIIASMPAVVTQALSRP
jgi:hypothetical protein